MPKESCRFFGTWHAVVYIVRSSVHEFRISGEGTEPQPFVSELGAGVTHEVCPDAGPVLGVCNRFKEDILIFRRDDLIVDPLGGAFLLPGVRHQVCERQAEVSGGLDEAKFFRLEIFYRVVSERDVLHHDPGLTVLDEAVAQILGLADVDRTVHTELHVDAGVRRGFVLLDDVGCKKLVDTRFALHDRDVLKAHLLGNRFGFVECHFFIFPLVAERGHADFACMVGLA